MALSTWCKSRGVDQQTANREIEHGKMPTPHRREEGHGWWKKDENGNRLREVLTAYDPEQQIEASRYALERKLAGLKGWQHFE
jgi:hypothetical protein